MSIIHWYFGFHARPHVGALLRREVPLQTACGHVEAWGYTEDQTWIFFDPQGAGTMLTITHHHDDVLERMARRYETCETILRIAPPGRKLVIPIHPLMNCAAQCGHLVGLRAYAPWTLRRMLLRNGAEVIHETERRPRGEEGA